ncbi:MAG: DUF2252 domain-containing protein [Blastocatellia bacterium]|nr:DUF2252 domain-containing protein [Blastocatellia bacterium]
METSYLIERIRQFNQGRDERLLKLKYKAMRADVFAFFRGSCHLFYEDWPKSTALNDAPPVWSCGDLHLENFGSYKGDNRLVYFDINDFDEAALAPCTWDIVRFLASVLLAADTLKLKHRGATSLCEHFLDAYAVALSQGRARTVEAETSTGLIKQLLTGLRERRRQDFLNEHTELKGGKRRFLIDGIHTLPVTDRERKLIQTAIRSWAARQPDPGFFEVLDVAHRIAGTGSLGVKRYILLVEGKGSPQRNYLLDFKEEPGSCLQAYLPIVQPQWSDAATRVVAVQERFQGTPPALLSAVKFEGLAFVLRELQPLQDRVSLRRRDEQPGRMVKLVRTMGNITAWDQLRSGGRQGSAIADDLIAFAESSRWRRAALELARAYAAQSEAYYRQFAWVTDDKLIEPSNLKHARPSRKQTAPHHKAMSRQEKQEKKKR